MCVCVYVCVCPNCMCEIKLRKQKISSIFPNLNRKVDFAKNPFLLLFMGKTKLTDEKKNKIK